MTEPVAKPLDELIEQIAAWPSGMPVRAMERVRAMSEAAVPAVAETLARWQDDDERDLLWLIVLLGELRCPSAVEPLIGQMRRTDDDILAQAAGEGLAKIGPPAVPAPFLRSRGPAIASSACTPTPAWAGSATTGRTPPSSRPWVETESWAMSWPALWPSMGGPKPSRSSTRPTRPASPGSGSSLRALSDSEEPPETCETCGAPLEHPTGVAACPETAVGITAYQLRFLTGAREDGLEDLFDLLDELEAEEWEHLERGEPVTPAARERWRDELDEFRTCHQTCEWLIEQGIEEVGPARARLLAEAARLADRYGDPEGLLRPAGPAQAHGPKVGRNDRCPCGSGLKYKRCCLGKA
jgi:hypothetical protein